MTDPTANDTPAGDAPKGLSNRWGCLALVAIPVLIVGGCTALSITAPEQRTDPFTVARQAAEASCERRVEGRLKAPSTAKYASTASVTTSSGGYTVKVTGNVDAQNSFGAMIRTPYRCTVTTNAEGTPTSVALDALG